MSELEPASKFFGEQELHFTPPDVVLCVLRGALHEAEAREIIVFVDKHAELAGGNVYCIYDMSEFVRITDSVRKIAIHVDKPYPYFAVAVIGTSFSTRMFADMIMRAGKLVSPKYFGFRHKFVASVAEANTWFDELRRDKKGL